MAYISFLNSFSAAHWIHFLPGQGRAVLLSHHSGLASEDLGWGCAMLFGQPLPLLQRITDLLPYSPDPEGFLPWGKKAWCGGLGMDRGKGVLFTWWGL